VTAPSRWAEYQFTILRAVPHVYRGEFANVGVIVHSRTEEYLAMRAILEPHALYAVVPGADIDLLVRYLTCYQGICEGNPEAGEIALLSRPERFHWLSAPRSDLLQPSPVHEGIGDDLDRVLEELHRSLVRPPEPRPDGKPVSGYPVT
jgi:hypothetical protein